jgi:hypothetical protein
MPVSPKVKADDFSWPKAGLPVATQAIAAKSAAVLRDRSNMVISKLGNFFQALRGSLGIG